MADRDLLIFSNGDDTIPVPDPLLLKQLGGLAKYYDAAMLLKPKPDCQHGIVFDEEASRDLSCEEVRRRWPRLGGLCPLGCGYSGIYYASAMHYIAGDW